MKTSSLNMTLSIIIIECTGMDFDNWNMEISLTHAQ